MKNIFAFLKSFRTLAVILGLTSIILAGAVRFFLTDLPESALGLLILGLVLILIYIIGALREIQDFLLSKHGRYSTNTAIMVIVFVVIMVLANFLGITYHKRFDFTSSNKFTLAPQTQRIISELKSPVKVIGFFPNEAQYRGAQLGVQNLLDEYKFFSKKFSYKFIDPDRKPAEAKKYRVNRNGTIVFISGKRRKAVYRATEQDFTGALLEVTGVEAKKVYFLSGHNEHDSNNSRKDGYSIARQGLIRDLYKVETLNLTLTPKVPEDCAVLIIAGPRKEFRPEEVKALIEFLKDRGKLLLLANPDPPKQISEILAEWGLDFAQGQVADRGAFVNPDMGTPAIFKGQYPPFVLTADLDTTYFPETGAIILTDELDRVLKSQPKTEKDPPGWPMSPVQFNRMAILPVLLSSRASWIETDKKNMKYDKGVDVPGPLAFGAMVIASATISEDINSPNSSGEKLTRIVLVGDSDFATNAHIQNGGNGDFFLNSVNWLAEEEHLISIRPKPYSFRRLVVSKEVTRFIRYSSVALMPFLTLVFGLIIWVRKR